VSNKLIVINDVVMVGDAHWLSLAHVTSWC